MNLRRLRDTIRQRAPPRLTPRHTRHTQKRPSTLTPLQIRFRRLKQPQMRLHIRAETQLPILLSRLIRKIHEIRQPRRSTVAHHHVQPTHLLDDFADHGGDGGPGGGVGFDGVEAGGVGVGVAGVERRDFGGAVDDGLGFFGAGEVVDYDAVVGC